MRTTHRMLGIHALCCLNLLGAGTLAAAEPAFADLVPSTHRNVAYVGDLGSMSRRLAAWGPFRDLLGRLWLIDILGHAQGQNAWDAERILAAMTETGDSLPNEIAISAPSEALDQIGLVLRLLGVVCALDGLEDLDAAEVEAVLPKLQAEALTLLDALRLPTCRVWVRLPQEALASQVMMQATQIALGIGPALGGKIDAKGSLTVSTTVGALFDQWEVDDLSLRAGMAGVGLLHSIGDPQAPDLVAGLRKIPLRAELRRIGAALVLDLEPMDDLAPGTGPLADCRGDERTLAILRLDSSHLAKDLLAIDTFVAGFAGTHLVDQIRIRDDDDFFGSMRRLADLLSNGEDRIEATLVLGDEGLELRSRLVGAKPRQDLRDLAVVDLVPDGSEGFSLDATRNLGEVLRDAWASVEDQLSQRIGVAMIAGKSDLLLSLTGVQTIIYGQLAALRTHLLDQAPTRFGPGTLWLIDQGDDCRRLLLEIGHAGRDLRLDVSDLPLPALLVAGTCADPRALITEWDGLLQAALGEGGGPVLIEQDLGLGEPTFTVDHARIAALAPEWSLSFDSAAHVHLVILKGHLLISTSLPLTSRVLAQRGRGRPDLRERLAAGRISWTVLESGAIHQLKAILDAWLERLRKLPNGALLGRSIGPLAMANAYAIGMAAGLQIYSEPLSLIEDMEMTVDQDPGGWTSQVHLHVTGLVGDPRAVPAALTP